MVESHDTLDVLIVGAGPTGSTLAIDLVRRGLRVRIIERNAHSFPGSRAKGLQPRTLEVFDDLGVVDAALAAGQTYPPLGIHVGPLTIPRRMYKIRKPSTAVPHPNTWLIPQFATDALLHRRLEQLGLSVEFNAKLETFVQQADHVTASITHTGGQETVRCKYLVGADGGGSAVREGLNIGFPGKTDEADRMIIVDCKVDGLSRNYWHAWPGLGGRFIVACPLPNSDLFQWMIRLKPDESPKLDEASINERVRSQTRNKNLRLHDIQWTSVFRPNIRLADHYGEGRVFLAGDAGHVHTPAGAQGLNTGVQDAYNLGWKLGQVLAGAPESLLATYEAERQPIAANVLGMSTKKYEEMRKGAASATKRGKDEQQLLLTYSAGPLARAGGDRTATLGVGDRAPDALLQDAHGKRQTLFELLRGPHFTAVAYGEAAAKDLSQFTWSAQGAELRRVTVNAGAHASGGIALSDPASSLRANYGLDRDTIVLIRPDGYIGQIASQDRLSTLQRAAAHLAPPLA